jgi:hypothetical protein
LKGRGFRGGIVDAAVAFEPSGNTIPEQVADESAAVTAKMRPQSIGHNVFGAHCRQNVHRHQALNQLQG